MNPDRTKLIVVAALSISLLGDLWAEEKNEHPRTDESRSGHGARTDETRTRIGGRGGVDLRNAYWPEATINSGNAGCCGPVFRVASPLTRKELEDVRQADAFPLLGARPPRDSVQRTWTQYVVLDSASIDLGIRGASR